MTSMSIMGGTRTWQIYTFSYTIEKVEDYAFSYTIEKVGDYAYSYPYTVNARIFRQIETNLFVILRYKESIPTSFEFIPSFHNYPASMQSVSLFLISSSSFSPQTCITNLSTKNNTLSTPKA